MGTTYKLVGGMVLALLIFAEAAAQPPLRWEITLDSAKRRAAQTDRLVLIHFWADWCGACRQMQQEVFSQPDVASALESDYVYVKINADYFPATRKHYGVTALPTDVIITPQGQPVERLQRISDPQEYAARLRQVAANVRSPRKGAYARVPAGPPTATGGWPVASPNTADGPSRQTPGYSDSLHSDGRVPRASVASVTPRYPDRPRADDDGPRRDMPGQPPIIPPQPAPAGLSAARSAAGNPPLGLDGYCPVHLADNRESWAKGDPRWGAIHRGQTYLFVGPEQQRRFLADPDRYAPVFSGNDVVLAVDHGQTVAGRREHGVFCGDQVYLFANEASLEKFSKNPYHYAQQGLQAIQNGPARPGRSVY